MSRQVPIYSNASVLIRCRRDNTSRFIEGDVNLFQVIQLFAIDFDSCAFRVNWGCWIQADFPVQAHPPRTDQYLGLRTRAIAPLRENARKPHPTNRLPVHNAMLNDVCTYQSGPVFRPSTCGLLTLISNVLGC